MTLTITFTLGRSERITYDHRYQHQGTILVVPLTSIEKMEPET